MPPFHKTETAADGAKKTTGILKRRTAVHLFILFVCFSAIVAVPKGISIRSDFQKGQKKNLNFMELLQETVTGKPEKSNEARIKELLNQCQEHLRAKRLTSGEEGTALDCYREVLRLSPANAQARAGLQSLEMQYVLWAKNALRGRNTEKARQYLEGLSKVNPASPALAELTREISPSAPDSAALPNTGQPTEEAEKPTPKKETEKPTPKKELKKPPPKKEKTKPSKKEKIKPSKKTKTKPSKKTKTKPSKKSQKRSEATEDFTEMSLGTGFNQKRRK